jgi:hypothetical protein
LVIRSAELVERLADEAKARQGTRTDLDPTFAPTGGNVGKSTPQTSDELGRIAGVSGTTIERVQRIHREVTGGQ